ncbi:MAG: hypothetical protein FJY07_08245, partial [Bacteroidetes bacterium]|nr:hypothetical protein [Bacteroidota bacterium]
MIKSIPSLIVLMMISASIFSQKNLQYPGDEFHKRGEVYFRFENSVKINLNEIPKIISVDHATTDQWIYAYASKKEFDRFLGYNLGFEILQHPGTLINPRMAGEIEVKNLQDWDFYPTYEAYLDMMYQLESLHPQLCDVFSIGQTAEGRELLMAKISKNVSIPETEPRFLYTSTMHGDETTGYVLMLRLIDYLLNNYLINEKVTQILDHTEVWINPLANPDGTYAGGNQTVFNATRYNGNNVDLNRNFPDPEDGEHPDGNAWQPETIEFMELADSVDFVMSANFHGGFEVFNYPWDTWPQLHADDDWWQYVGREWADTVHTYSPTGYFDEMDNGITNGYAWYTLAGGRQDFMNYFHQCREVTVELSFVKILPENG